MFGETFPWGTLIVNIFGSFVIGFFGALTGPDGRLYASSAVRQFAMIGLCGGYTTFSAFSLQTLNLMNDAEWFSRRRQCRPLRRVLPDRRLDGSCAGVELQLHEVDLMMQIQRDAVLLAHLLRRG